MNPKSPFDIKELLKPDNMLRLYASGAFPMADEVTGNINWFMPEVRTIIPLENYNIPRSARKAIEKVDFEISFNTNLMAVVEGCADRERQHGFRVS